jgi:hypothetical protein
MLESPQRAACLKTHQSLRRGPYVTHIQYCGLTLCVLRCATPQRSTGDPARLKRLAHRLVTRWQMTVNRQVEAMGPDCPLANTSSIFSNCRDYMSKEVCPSSLRD